MMADVNHDLFVKVLAQIERHPETWNQGPYIAVTACGTSHCFGGWAASLSGWDWNDSHECGLDAFMETALGVSGYEGYDGWLFCPDNTLDDLYRISADLMGIDEQVLRDKVAAEVQS